MPDQLHEVQRNPLERLIRATPELVGELDVGRLLQRVADLARELLDARYAAIGLLSADRRSLASFVTSGLAEDERARIGALPTGKGVLGLVIREGKVVRLKKIGAHPASAGFPANHPPMDSFLGVPVIGRDGVLGDLYLTEKLGADEFGDDDVGVALLLASIVASAVENARFHEQTTRLLEEVQQLHRSRERFFAMVNHELRNSLAAVFGWAELMVRKKDPAAVPRGAYEILEAAEQSVTLVNDLLDLNRLDEDRLKPVLRDVECGATIRAAVQRLTPAAAEKQIRFKVPTVDHSIVCRTDAHRVEQILVNVLSNAIRHTPAGSEITLDFNHADGVAVLTIDDEGPGVPVDELERIFDIYYTTAGQEGTGVGSGIGLPLSRRLARLLGGELCAQSRAGPGARFVLKLPLAES
ncbi:MAG: ATP-binding protein [Gemmatimonadales bacterium]